MRLSSTLYKLKPEYAATNPHPENGLVFFNITVWVYHRDRYTPRHRVEIGLLNNILEVMRASTYILVYLIEKRKHCGQCCRLETGGPAKAETLRNFA